jgi:DNA-3-methyladenine glycosylase I
MDENVGSASKAMDDLAACTLIEVNTDAPFVAAVAEKGGGLAAPLRSKVTDVVAGPWAFDLDHVGSEITEQFCAVRSRDVLREINNSKAVERKRHSYTYVIMLESGFSGARRNAIIQIEMSYCSFAPEHPIHGPYHDLEYGFPIEDDKALFERLVLEINQAGLSWLTILTKRENFRAAYEGFAIERIAKYGERERKRLLADAGIIRNRLKVDAAITNAGKLLEIRESHGSFAAWLDAHHPRAKADWVKLFKKTFAFTGGEITGEFLLSTGYLPGAHVEDCPVYAKIARLKPPWMRA